jgi:DNA polymerase-3 subunit beta
VASGKSRFNLQTLSAEEFPTVAQAEFTADFTLPAATLKYLLSMVHFAMAQQDIRYYLNGMLLVVDGTTVRAVATDGHRLALCEVQKDGASAKIEAIIPRKTILELARLLPDSDDPVRVQMAATQVKFTFGEIELISKLVEGKFPDYQRVVPAANSKVFAIGREDLMHSLQRAAILTTDKFKGVRLCWRPAPQDQLDQRRSGRRPGRVGDRVFGEGLDIGFNVNYLLDVLLNIKSEQLKFALGDALGSALDDVAGLGQVQVRRDADADLRT